MQIKIKPLQLNRKEGFSIRSWEYLRTPRPDSTSLSLFSAGHLKSPLCTPAPPACLACGDRCHPPALAFLPLAEPCQLSSPISNYLERKSDRASDRGVLSGLSVLAGEWRSRSCRWLTYSFIQQKIYGVPTLCQALLRVPGPHGAHLLVQRRQTRNSPLNV